jgi:hypothetical protein
VKRYPVLFFPSRFALSTTRNRENWQKGCHLCNLNSGTRPNFSLLCTALLIILCYYCEADAELILHRGGRQSVQAFNHLLPSRRLGSKTVSVVMTPSRLPGISISFSISNSGRVSGGLIRSTSFFCDLAGAVVSHCSGKPQAICGHPLFLSCLSIYV